MRQSWQPFRHPKTGIKPARKVRPIRFASRRDAYIYSAYRYKLSAPYEKLLNEIGISECVLAYRRLKDERGRGKSNIDFACEAFEKIAELKTCAAVALDISSFFESLDHTVLQRQWGKVLGVEQLPRDHQAVFKSLTAYTVVDRDAVYERLGYSKREAMGAGTRLTYAFSRHEVPKKLCSNSDFREKICGKGGTYPSLIRRNRKPFGIPQGSPISDLLANIYLIDFDVALNDYCRRRGGVYVRYSDDVLMLVPGSALEADGAAEFAQKEIARHGAKLVIKSAKTSAVLFEQVGDRQVFTNHRGKQGANGLEYLGFRFDGQRAYVRNATISRLYRKVALSTRAEVAALISRYPGKSYDFLRSAFDQAAFLQRYGRVEDFKPAAAYTDWTFWTYVKRAIQRFGIMGAPMARQLANYRRVVRRRIELELSRQLSG